MASKRYVVRQSNSDKMESVSFLERMVIVSLAMVSLLEFMALQKFANGDIMWQFAMAIVSIYMSASRFGLEAAMRKAAVNHDHKEYERASRLLKASGAFFLFSLALLVVSHYESVAQNEAAASLPAKLAMAQVEKTQNELNAFNSQLKVSRTELEMSESKLIQLQSQKAALIESHNKSIADEMKSWQLAENGFWNSKLRGVVYSEIMNKDCTPINNYVSLAKQVCTEYRALLAKKPSVSNITGVNEIDTSISALSANIASLERLKYLEQALHSANENYASVLTSGAVVSNSQEIFVKINNAIYSVTKIDIGPVWFMVIMLCFIGWFVLNSGLVMKNLSTQIMGISKSEFNQQAALRNAEKQTNKPSVLSVFMGQARQWLDRKKQQPLQPSPVMATMTRQRNKTAPRKVNIGKIDLPTNEPKKRKPRARKQASKNEIGFTSGLF
jgi:hypothetical protein